MSDLFPDEFHHHTGYHWWLRLAEQTVVGGVLSALLYLVLSVTIPEMQREFYEEMRAQQEWSQQQREAADEANQRDRHKENAAWQQAIDKLVQAIERLRQDIQKLRKE